MTSKPMWVYILGGRGTTIYVGVTDHIVRRTWEHKNRIGCKFTTKYNLDQLLYYVEFSDPVEAIAWEKKLKRWLRPRKDALIDEMNAERIDLAADWYSPATRHPHLGDSSARSHRYAIPRAPNSRRASIRMTCVAKLHSPTA